MKKMLKIRHKIKNAKYIFEVHQILSQNYCREGKYKKAEEIKRLEEFVFNNVDILICITKTLSNEIQKIFTNATKKHLILPVGFSKKFLNITQNDYKYDLIYSGNFSKWKGIDYLVNALKRVVEKIPTFKAILIGTNKIEYKYYSALIKKLDLEKNITLLNRIPHKNIIEYVAQSKIGVLPNSYDGDALLFTSPLKLYEYLGAGLKVVSSKLAPIESAIDNDLIYWATPENSNSLSKAIIKAYCDNNYDANKSKEFAKNFTWNNRAKKFIDFLK